MTIAAFYLTCTILTISDLLLYLHVLQSKDQKDRNQENEPAQQVVDVFNSNALLDLNGHSGAKNGRYLDDDGEVCAKKAKTFCGYVVDWVWRLG